MTNIWQYDYSNKLNSTCYDTSRAPIDVLVAHDTCGPSDDNATTDPVVALARSNAAANYLCSNDRTVSVHWLVGAEAAGAPIYRIVPEAYTAYQCGGNPPAYPSNWRNPQTGVNIGGYPLNQHSIGIERFGQVTDTVGPNQRAALNRLVADIASRYPNFLLPGHIVAHASLEGDRQDGRVWVALAGAAATSIGINKLPTPTPKPPAPLPPIVNPNPKNLAVGTGMMDEARKRGHIFDTSEQYMNPAANQPGLMTRSMAWAHDAKGAIFVYIAYQQAPDVWAVHVYSEVP